MYTFCICQTNGQYKFISSEEHFFKDEVIINKDTVNFSGYLIFKIYKHPYSGYFPVNNKYYFCNIYWVNNISDIENTAKIYFYPTILLESSRCFKGDPSEFINYEEPVISEKDSVFCQFLSDYKKNKEKNITLLPFLFEPLNTKIFEKGVNFWCSNNTDTIGYFIFKNQFQAKSILGTIVISDLNKRIDYFNKKEVELLKNIENAITLVPITKAKVFEPANHEELTILGFTKAEWFPDNIYK